MKAWMKAAICISLSLMCLFTCFGYAAISDNLKISGDIQSEASVPDIYITNVTPSTSAGVSVVGYSGTVLTVNISGRGTATFTVTVQNASDKVYVYERTLDGVEAGIPGAAELTGVTYQSSGITSLDEVAPRGGVRTFQVSITVPAGVTASNYILYFKFIEKQGTEILPGNDEFDVTFKYNNGKADAVVRVHINGFIPRPETPLRTGYRFTGWYTDTTYTTVWNFDIDRPTEAMTLYAGWEEEATEPTEYNVTFRPGNGDANVTMTVAADSLIPLPATPVMEGYTFIGWYTDASWTTPWNFDTDKINSNTILYGGWEVYVKPVPPELYITFQPNNGEPAETRIVMTGDFIPRPPVPVKDGYIFVSWYTDEGCTQPWNFEASKPESDMTLYGGWVEAPKEYTITFKPNNGDADIVFAVQEGSLVPRPELPVREGYTFIGWYKDAECTEGWNLDADIPTADMTLYGGWEKETDPGNEPHSDFMGLVEALLSDSNNCLNHSDLIFDAVMESLTSKKRPKEDAPILHCSVNSVSGGTMSAIATYANSKLTANLHFIFEVDPDPAYQDTRLRLYMYYGDECDDANDGDRIMVYKQIVSRGSDGVWFADGTYIGTAVVGDYFGGGNSGKDVKTISPYTWLSDAKSIEE